MTAVYNAATHELSVNSTGSESITISRVFDDKIHGNTGNDTIAGGSGNDLLYGDSGTNQLLGEGGNDTLLGGSQLDNSGTIDSAAACASFRHQNEAAHRIPTTFISLNPFGRYQCSILNINRLPPGIVQFRPYVNRLTSNAAAGTDMDGSKAPYRWR